MTKVASEALSRSYARHSGLDVVVLRYFTVYGPRQRPDMLFARAIRALIDDSPLEIYGDGTQSRAFSYVADTVSATIKAMEAERTSPVYNVGSSEEATIQQTLAMLEEIAGDSIDVRYGPKAVGDVRRTSADTSRIRAELGWEPHVRLADGLRMHWEWAQSRAPVGLWGKSAAVL
jgi:nucleoside-diphosphate-sugar epimerase